jgi:uncharacterized protein
MEYRSLERSILAKSDAVICVEGRGPSGGPQPAAPGAVESVEEEETMNARCWPMLLLVLCWAPAHAAYPEGLEAYERGDYARALRELVPAADADPRAASLLADIHARGLGTPPDAQQALMWRRRAAELGDSAAQTRLGAAYAAGSPQDQREALLWYRRAAEQGDRLAQYELGRAYAEGRGVPADGAEALRWMSQAAQAGVPEAAAWLARAYEHGIGVEPDREQAARWRSRAVPPATVALAPPPRPGREGGRNSGPHGDSARACSSGDVYDCAAVRRRDAELRYGLGMYSGGPGYWYDPWYWDGPGFWGPPYWGPSHRAGWGSPYAGWGWRPGHRSAWSFGFSWGF